MSRPPNDRWDKCEPTRPVGANTTKEKETSCPKPNASAARKVRHSQVVTTFGTGSLVDPTLNQLGVVAGLDHWSGCQRGGHRASRTWSRSCKAARPARLKLFSPPTDTEDPTAPAKQASRMAIFPSGSFTTGVKSGGGVGQNASRLLVHCKALPRANYIDTRQAQAPVRADSGFVRACAKGHSGH